jgi:hypothetical protein
MAGGGLMQLVAYGAQDVYLTGNPQITFFKVVYRRHTNFSTECIEQTVNGTAGYGNRSSVTISRNGDLVGRTHFEYTQSGIDATACANPGSALIDNVVLEIGGQQIDKHYGHWMEAWAQLSEKNDTGTNPTNALVAVQSNEATSWTAFQMMSGMGGVLGAGDTMEKLFIPLQFSFCRNPGLALPLIALQYHEVKLTISLNSAAACGGNATFGTFAVWCDYHYLDTDERRRFAQVSHEYLIEQVQFQNHTSATSMELNFNHPVKELIWTGGVTTGGPDNVTGPSTPLSVATGSTYKLVLNGHDRFAARDYRYFTREQVWEHHTGRSSNNVIDSIGVYSFALKPEEHQPSGTCNFSRIDNARLILGAAQALNVYGVNYNVLRIMSGMGGLAYSN